ncbi:MAG: protein-glutamate O-methyltransferase CheR [Actinomycetota bacterium]
MTIPRSIAASDREFPFDDRHFELFRSLAGELAGIELDDTKRELVYGRLARRLRALGLASFDSYAARLRVDGPNELPEFVNAITTNVTSFFRESHHFAFLADEAIPDLLTRRSVSRRLRIWSAACSTGQEPYSIAITAATTLPGDTTWDCRILATDIDGSVVATAEAGTYPIDTLPDRGLLPDRSRWFRAIESSDRREVRVAEELRSMIYFRRLNLIDPWPMQGPIDIIFCRNVVIYFSTETQRRLFRRFAEILAPDGYLFVGHSESILHSADLFESVGRTVYRPRQVRP